MIGAGIRIGKAIENLRVLEFTASKKYRHLMLGSFVLCLYTIPSLQPQARLTSYSLCPLDVGSSCAFRRLCRH